MTERTLLVVGAAGDVGQGVVRAALKSGRCVVASGRTAATLEELAAYHKTRLLACVAGSIGSESSAADLWERAQDAFGRVDEVVVSVNSSGPMQPLLDWTADALSETLSDNLVPHFVAARTFLPRLPDDGVLLGIGGGTADFVISNMAQFSIVQAGLRMLYRALGKECRDGLTVRELMIVSMVNGASSRDRAKPDWITDEDVGRHVCAILDAPDRFPETILQLKSREQVGLPEVSA